MPSRKYALLVLISLASICAQALGPHELLVLVNGKSLRSKEVANAFARQRDIPARNMVYLDLPDSVLEPAAEMTPLDFTRMIWEPANAVARSRGIEDHILAWVYSVDFPVRVTTDPLMSIQGITFTRNNVPPAEMIQKGAYLSPLFAGPDAADQAALPTRSLEGFCVQLQTRMPLPSMMLGFTGSRGSTVESVLRVLSRGSLSDHTAPPGSVYFVANEDVRSKCRAWQYPGARQELEQLRVASQITTDFPDPSAKVVGLMSGQPWINANIIGNARPGCMADHLTSFSAVFDNYDQSKTTEWLNGGAVSSAGIVTEPLAIWTKFPHARLFVHYAMGCTILESFYQATRCPLQLLILGEPLASPWSPALSMVLVQTDDGSVADKASFHAQIFPAAPQPAPDYLYLLDGRSLNAPSKPDIEIGTTRLADGYHELRVIAYLQGGVRHQVFATAGFTVDRKKRSVRLAEISSDAAVDLFHPVKVRISASGKPDKVGVTCGERVLATSTPGESGEADAVLEPQDLGPGKIAIQAFAEYADGDRVRGEPILLHVSILNQAPSIDAVAVSTNAAGDRVLSPGVSDAEKDSIDVRWFQVLPSVKAVSGKAEATTGGIRLTPPAEGFGIAICSNMLSERVDEVAATVRFVQNQPAYRNQYAGLVFDFKDGRNFSFFGFHGDPCAWALGVCRDGAITWKAARGNAIQPEKEYVLSVRKKGSTGVECRVNDELLIGGADLSLGSGPVGFMAAGASAEFQQAAVNPPSCPADVFRVEGGTLSISKSAAVGRALFIRVSDGHRSARKPVLFPSP